MLNSVLVGTYGLTNEQNKKVAGNFPTKDWKLMDTDCFTDIIAVNQVASVINADTLTNDELQVLEDYYTEIIPCSDTIILIGTERISSAVKRHMLCYKDFNEFERNMKYVFLKARGRMIKTVNYSNQLTQALMILSEIRIHPYITSHELSEKLEIPVRTVQRQIESLRVAGEWIEYDFSKRGWYLTEGKSILWGDI